MENQENKELKIQEDITSKIEDLRANMLNDYLKGRKTSIIILIVFVVLMLGGIGLMISLPNKIHIVFMAMVIVFFGTSLLAKKLRKNSQNIIKTYVENYRSIINENIYGSENVKMDFFGKIDIDFINDLQILNNVNHVESNDLVEFKINNNNCKAISCACYDKDNKIMFLGKAYQANLDTSLDIDLVVYLKSNDGNGPTLNKNMNEYKELLDNRFNVYSSYNKESVVNILNKGMKEKIEAYQLNEYIKDVIFVIKNKTITCLVSTRNDILDVAFKTEFNNEIFITLKTLKNNFESLIGEVK